MEKPAELSRFAKWLHDGEAAFKKLKPGWAARPCEDGEQSIGCAYYVTPSWPMRGNDGSFDIIRRREPNGPDRMVFGSRSEQEVAAYMDERVAKGWFLAVDDIEGADALAWRKGATQ